LPEYAAVRHIFEEGGSLDANQKALIADIWGDLQYAHKFGSLIRLDEKLKERLRGFLSKKANQTRLFSDQQLGIQPTPTQLDPFLEHDIAQEQEFIRRFFDSLKNAVEQFAQTKENSFLASQAQDAVTFLELLNQHYDVAAANPPYTDSGEFGPELKIFVEANYKKPNAFRANLYAVFIKRCYEFVSQHGYIAMVHPPTFMYIKTFEDVRKFIIEKSHIELFVEWGYLGMFNPSARVDSAVYILKKAQKDSVDSVFIKLNNLYETKRYDALFEAFDQYLAGETHELLYTIPQSKLKIIESWPFIYWISDEFREKFGKNSLENYFKVSQGMSVSNGERFLRFNWELLHNDIFNGKKAPSIKWARFPKGGPYKKWTGNLWLCVNWKDDGKELKGYSKAVLRNQKYYFVEGITYSSSGSKGTTFRILPESAVISGGGPGIHKTSDDYSTLYCLGYLNSKFVSYIINCLNPTVNTTQGDLNRIPLLGIGKDSIKVVENCVKKCIDLSTILRKYSIVEDNFVGSPIKTKNGTLKESIQDFLSYENYLNTLIVLFQSIIDEKILANDILPEVDKELILNKEGESIGSLPVSAEAREAYLAAEIEDFPLEPIRAFIEALPVKTFSAEERAAVESEFPSLYQANNDLEEFCIRHQVNPINVWYWFKQANILPEQRMHTLAMEFLADLIREILMQDEDGIIPLANGSGEKALLERIEDKFYEKGFSQAQFSTFDSVLGYPLEEYINRHFFAALSDHLNLFMYLPKTPFIWHLSSGPEQGFDCYIIIYKWSRDKLLRIRSQYIERRERALLNRQSDLAGNPSAEAQNKKDKIFKQLKEIEAFKKKIDELLSEGYNPILDDGVGKNIAPLQKKGMLPYDVLNPGQLDKYLHADW